MKPYIGIPAVIVLVHRAWSRKSLTTPGLIAAALTASAHALHPWSAPFVLLGVFYFGGTKVTKVYILSNIVDPRFVIANRTLARLNTMSKLI